MQYEHTINELNLLRAKWPMEPALILGFCAVLIEGESLTLPDCKRPLRHRYPEDTVTLYRS